MDWRHGNRSILQCSVFGTGERNPKRRNVYIYDLPIHHSKNPWNVTNGYKQMKEKSTVFAPACQLC
jgi:hypothetical protein